MIHISKLENRRVEKVEDVLNIGDMTWVKVTEIDEGPRQPLHQGEDLLLVDEIEMVRRFVEQQQLRILRQNLCEKRALQFAAGERKNRLLAFVLHAGQG